MMAGKVDGAATVLADADERDRQVVGVAISLTLQLDVALALINALTLQAASEWRRLTTAATAAHRL